MEDSLDSWEKFLHPETVKTNLISMSLFITSFESFKNTVTRRVETFFVDQVDGQNQIVCEEYKLRVLSLSKSKLYASLLWLKSMHAIDQMDMDDFDAIRRYRNELAHEPMEFLIDSKRNFDVSIFRKLIGLLQKIENWWFVNIEIAIDPDILPEGVNPDDVIKIPILSLQLMQDIALGNEPENGYYYRAYQIAKAAAK